MRESSDFHAKATPTFVGTRFKENLERNPKRVSEHTPWARTMLHLLHPYGTILNLDIIDFRNTEKLIDEWVAALKIEATTLELDQENFIRLVELSLEGSANCRRHQSQYPCKRFQKRNSAHQDTLYLRRILRRKQKRLENIHKLSLALN
ncbi:UNVERIFIED_CONTAM: hypothetical protein Sradi_0685700 [Sesamum radiatum]|uniref:Uncharacterized protein n=1 Tax=Sesamum radiatum TaxID=300843 RepID=A0AAW2VN02_SESRA